MPHHSDSPGRVVGVVRTCIGCRERADMTTLVRLVAEKVGTITVVQPDPRRSLPGRGAHLHPTTRCLELATTRKAFGRAFRLDGPFDLDAVRSLVTSQAPAHHDSPARQNKAQRTADQAAPDPKTEHPLMDHR